MDRHIHMWVSLEIGMYIHMGLVVTDAYMFIQVSTGKFSNSRLFFQGSLSGVRDGKKHC
jgi:hypothetical protein